MKKILSLCLIVCLSLGLAGCAGKQSATDQKEKPLIVTTLFPSYDMAKQVVGDKAEVKLLLPPGADAHSFSLKPADIITLKEADVIIYTGDDMEPWMKKAKEQLTDKTLVVDLSACVSLLDQEESEKYSLLKHDEDAHHEHEHAHTDEKACEHCMSCENCELEHHETCQDCEAGHHHASDPHIWTSLRNAQQMVNEIAQNLGVKDETNKQLYLENAKAYQEELAKLDKTYTETIDKLPNKTLVLADEFPFLYLCRDYGLNFIGLFDSCSEASEPSAKRMKELEDYIKEHQVKTVLYTTPTPSILAQNVAKNTGAGLALLNASHLLEAKELESGTTYLAIMKQNLNVIEQALKNEG